jgi:flagellar biosynthesis/type III secretory pathway chaperone
MPHESISDRDLNQLLDQQIAAMQAVLETLEGERAALKARDGEALLRAVDRKAASIAAADVIEDRRQALFQRLGLADRPGGLAGRGLAADGGMGQRWQQVLALTRQCRAFNDANGQFIRGQRRRAAETLRLVRGDAAVSAEYDAAGAERSSRIAPRSITSI